MPKEEEKQRGFSAIIVAVIAGLIVAGIVAGYQYIWLPRQQELSPQKLPLAEEKVTSTPQTPTPIPKDETADWKTYKNEEYGFEVKYPKDWEVVEDSSILFFDNPLYAKEYKLLEGPGFSYKYKDYAWIDIGRYPEGVRTSAGTVTKDTKIKDFVYKLYSKDHFVSVEETAIGDQEAFIFGYKPTWGGDETILKSGENDYFQAYFKQNNDIIIISMWSGLEYMGYKKLVTAFNQILSTFNFIK